MPEISRFLGIIITMNWQEDQHHRAHFHARYNKFQAVISIPDCAVLNSNLPPRVLGLVIEWAKQHLGELETDWILAQNRQSLNKIEPLI